ncbi:MAG TPA: TonB family protein [Nevskiaceae bacterium]|nr:TonB family protein [Nevskiaceae bacterium]
MRTPRHRLRASLAVSLLLHAAVLAWAIPSLMRLDLAPPVSASAPLAVIPVTVEVPPPAAAAPALQLAARLGTAGDPARLSEAQRSALAEVARALPPPLALARSLDDAARQAAAEYRRRTQAALAADAGFQIDLALELEAIALLADAPLPADPRVLDSAELETVARELAALYAQGPGATPPPTPAPEPRPEPAPPRPAEPPPRAARSRPPPRDPPRSADPPAPAEAADRERREQAQREQAQREQARRAAEQAAEQASRTAEQARLELGRSIDRALDQSLSQAPRSEAPPAPVLPRVSPPLPRFEAAPAPFNPAAPLAGPALPADDFAPPVQTSPGFEEPPLARALDAPPAGLRPGAATAPDRGPGVETADANAFFSRLTAHLFAANQRALAEAVRADQRLRVEVRFLVDRDGRVLDAWPKRGTGNARLDAKAVQTILDASPLPRLAADMPQQRLELSFPVEIYR